MRRILSYYVPVLVGLLSVGVINADTEPHSPHSSSLWQNLMYQANNGDKELLATLGCSIPVGKCKEVGNGCNIMAAPSAQTETIIMQIPYKEQFLNESSFSKFTVVDNDNDGNTWHFVLEQDFFTDETEGYAKVFINGENVGHVSDDWLLTPPISLRKGKAYILKFIASGFDGCNDTFDVYIGKSAGHFDKDTYRAILLHQNLNTSEPTEYSVPVEVDSDGNFSFAFHYTSSFQNNGFFMTVDDISVDINGNGEETPGGVTAMSVVPDSSGNLQAEICFNAPSLTCSGNSLTSLSSIALVRENDNVVIHTFENPKIAERLSFIDTTPPCGYVRYTAVPYNDGGRGEAVTLTGYVGEDIPLGPKDVTFVDNLDGTAGLSWLSPGNIGERGERVNESRLTYNLYSSEGNLLEDGITETSLTFTDMPVTGEQSLARVRVAARSMAGEGQSVLSSEVIIGQPFTLPYYESFPKGEQSHYFYWQEGNSRSKFKPTETMSSDGDGGCIFWTALDHNEYIRFCFGKFAIRDAANPIMAFSYYAAPDQDIEIDVEIDNPFHSVMTVKHIDYKELLGKEGWRSVIIDLSDFKDYAYIIPKIRCEGEDALSYSVVLDDFRFFDATDNDLAVTLLDYPEKAHTGDSLEIRARIDNHSMSDAQGYAVVLKSGDVELTRMEGPTVSSLQHKDVTLPFTVPSDMVGYHAINLEIVSEQDTYKEDNIVSFSLDITETVLPAINNLTCSVEDSHVNLAWAHPAGNGILSDDFSFYRPFSISNFGRWTTIDSDGGQTFGISYYDYPHCNDPKAFMVFHPEVVGINLEENPSFASNNGDQYLMSFCTDLTTTAEGYTSDWLISPLLASGTQTVKMQVGAFWDFIGGDIVLYYSDTANRKENFINFGKIEKIKSGFENFEFTLPEDAKYFALEFMPQNNGALLLDEISFRPEYLEVKGYNIYRDNELVATVSANQTSYTDTKPISSRCEYCVSAVYTAGESEPSDKITVDAAGISSHSHDNYSIHTDYNGIFIKNVGGVKVSVVNASGITVFEAKGKETIDINLPQGAYIVRIGNDAVKALVR